MNSYINQAAMNRGWEVKKIVTTGDYLTKYTKGVYFFYSDGISTIPINNQSYKISINKVHTSHILEEENIPCVSTREIDLRDINNCRTLFHHFSNGTKVIVKPIDGKKGDGLVVFDTLEQLEQYSLSAPKTRRHCISSYYPHQCEIRFILFQKKVEMYHFKPNNPNNPLRPYLNESFTLDATVLLNLKNLAEKTALCLGFNYLAVDFLVSEKEQKVIEVNTSPNLYSYIRANPEQYERCVELYERMFDFKEFLLKSITR